MSINNREDANKYYEIINSLIDQYIEKWKIKPSRLKRYLKPGTERFDNFLTKNKLNGIKGADKVLKDVIEDRVAMEKDSIMTFENYKFFESEDYNLVELETTLYKGLGKANVSMEKYLADYYDTNLSDIDIVDTDKRLFRVSAWSYKDVNVIIYTDEDMEVIKGNVIDFYYNELKNKDVILSDNITIRMFDLMTRENLERVLSKRLEFGSDSNLIDIISDIINGDLVKNDNNKYFIWELKDRI
jgi:hypothetical protein